MTQRSTDGPPPDLTAFRTLVERAGLADVPDEDIERMHTYWLGARVQIASLREAIALADEPATVFLAAPSRLH